MQDVVKEIIEVITNNFPKGIRDDFIDANKILRIYSANHTDENISRDLIAEVIHSNGLEDGGRFYFISESDAENIRLVFDEILAAHSIAYYSTVHEKHADFFSRLHIFSPEVLKKILQENDTGYFYFDEFCSASRMTRLDYEVSKIFMAAKKSLSLEDLQEKLPYVPREKILAALSNEKRYLPTNAGKFFPISKIQFDMDEIHAAKQKIISAVDANGYATPEDYSLSSNFALNPELNEKNLCNVIYKKFFAAEFTKQGRKFFKKGIVAARKKISAVNCIREFVAAHDELSVEKLLNFSKSVDPAPSVALSVAHEQMIRVEKNLFVKDALITFDVAGVDEALSSFVQGKIISLRAVTSFTGFPPVAGYSWNLYLLESFLRKHSQRYVYDTAAANSANAGAIYSKRMKFEDYLDVQASAVVQEKIPLEKSAVEEFLIGQGFRARRIDKVTERIINRSQEILNR